MGDAVDVSLQRRTLMFVVLGLLVWALLASLIAAYYFYSYNDLFNKIQKPTVYVSIGINYGNGTSARWFNHTGVQAGENLLNVTLLVAEVKYTVWPGSGAFADSIDNVKNSGSYYWLWWMYTSFGWSQGQVACDRYIVGDNETYYWYYEDTSIFPAPSPP